MEEKEIRVNTFLKSFFDFEFNEHRLLLNNIDLFYNIIQKLRVAVQSICRENNLEIDFTKITKLSFLEQESLINDFFKELSVNFKLDDIIKDGTLDLQTVSICANDYLYYYSGHTGKLDNHINIQAYNTGLISDSAIWIHEIEHYLMSQMKEEAK